MPKPQSRTKEKLEILSFGKRIPGGHPITGKSHSIDVTDGLTIRQGHRTARFDSVWLRDSCACEQCVDPHSGQKNFQTAHIPEDIGITSVQVIDDESVLLRWTKDIEGINQGHHSTFKGQYLLDKAENGKSDNYIWPKIWGERSLSERMQILPYEGFLSHDITLGDALVKLQRHGLIILDGVPESEVSVERIAERIGPLRHTFYGRTWDVKDKPKAENVAYTSKHLGLHMDLLYMKDPPGIQLLHCLKSSSEGGNSIFRDAFEAARDLKFASPKYYKDLVRIPVRYKYDVGGYFYTDSKKTFEVDILDPMRGSDQILTFVNWSPPFQGTFEIGYGRQDEGNELQDYLRAAKAFAAIVDDPNRQLEHRLEPGQCVIFNNRRILHGRKEFQSGTGERWLKGAYVNTEDFKSTLHKHVERRAAASLKVSEMASNSGEIQTEALRRLERDGPYGRHLVRRHVVGPTTQKGGTTPISTRTSQAPKSPRRTRILASYS